MNVEQGSNLTNNNTMPTFLENDFLEPPSHNPIIPKSWTLKWSDEFHNESSLLNWNLQDWASDKNGEWQYYSPNNINIHNGI